MGSRRCVKPFANGTQRNLAPLTTPPEAIFTSGGKHALFGAISALIEAGDEVVIPAPYWVSFPDIVKCADGTPVFVETRAADGFSLRAADVEKAITSRTKMLIVNSPNNPTGAVLPNSEFARIFEICQRRNIWLLADECYSHFLYGGVKPYSIASMAGAKEHVIVAGSLSKTFSMTGWRAGFALGPEPVISAMNKLQSQSISNPNSITQKAAIAALTSPMDSVAQMLAEYTRRRERVLAGVRAIPGVTCTEPQGAFYVFPNVSKHLGRPGLAADTTTLAQAIAGARACGGGRRRSVWRARPPAHLLCHLG